MARRGATVEDETVDFIEFKYTLKNLARGLGGCRKTSEVAFP